MEEMTEGRMDRQKKESEIKQKVQLKERRTG